MVKELKIKGFVMENGVNVVANVIDNNSVGDPAVVLNQGDKYTLVPLVPQTEDGKMILNPAAFIGTFTPTKQLTNAYQQFVRNCTSARTGIFLPPSAH